MDSKKVTVLQLSNYEIGDTLGTGIIKINFKVHSDVLKSQKIRRTAPMLR